MACIGKRCKLMIILCRHPAHYLEMLQRGNTRAKRDIIWGRGSGIQAEAWSYRVLLTAKLLVLFIYED
jgi:hypothetical protein